MKGHKCRKIECCLMWYFPLELPLSLTISCLFPRRRATASSSSTCRFRDAAVSRLTSPLSSRAGHRLHQEEHRAVQRLRRRLLPGSGLLRGVARAAAPLSYCESHFHIGHFYLHCLPLGPTRGVVITFEP